MAADFIAVDLLGISADVAVAYTRPAYYASLGQLEVKVLVAGEDRARRLGFPNSCPTNLSSATAAVQVRGLLRQAA